MLLSENTRGLWENQEPKMTVDLLFLLIVEKRKLKALHLISGLHVGLQTE